MHSLTHSLLIIISWISNSLARTFITSSLFIHPHFFIHAVSIQQCIINLVLKIDLFIRVIIDFGYIKTVRFIRLNKVVQLNFYQSSAHGCAYMHLWLGAYQAIFFDEELHQSCIFSILSNVWLGTYQGDDPWRFSATVSTRTRRMNRL